MPLTGREAFARGFIRQGTESQVRPASYDLRVGKLIIDNKIYDQSVKLMPQQMFIIVSQEHVAVPPGYVGYAEPKTSLCNDGILCLNTGIIDPGYSGLISTTAINFSSEPYLLSPGASFLRAVFLELAGDGKDEIRQSSTLSDNAYIEDRKRHAIRYPRAFLDVPGQISGITSDVESRVTNKFIGLLVLVLTISTLIYALWNLELIQRQVAVTATQSIRADSLARRIDLFQERLGTLDTVSAAYMRRLDSLARHK